MTTCSSWWMKATGGSEEQYNKNVINSFKHGEHPEIIIVVDKLLTGFDAPRNTVLYLTRLLKDHTLLQAIARVNRLFEGKDFGYIIDYRGVLQNLNNAFDLYGKLEDGDSLPEKLRNQEVAKAFFGALKDLLGRHCEDAGTGRELAADAALQIDQFIQEEKIVSWTTNSDVQNRMKNRIEDYLHDLKDETGLAITFEGIDDILEKCLDIAKRRYPE